MTLPSRLSCLRLLLTALPVIAPSARAQQSPPRDIVQRTGTSAIRGRVVSSDAGTPIRRAAVRLTSPEVQGARTTSTDPEGRFEFAQLAAGRYTVTVSKAAYVSWSYGQTRPSGPGKSIVLGENQLADGITIPLPRGAVITGRVIDEFGEPVANASVTSMRQTYSEGRRRLNQAGQTQTNDIGEYRLFGLT